MSKDFFKVKKGLHIKPSDPSTLTDLEDGDIIVDSTDNQLKKYSEEDGEFATIAGSGGAVANFFSDFDKLTPTLAQASVADDAVVFLPIDDNKKSKKITYTAAGSALYQVAASADLEGAQGLMTIWIKTDVQGVTVSTTTDGAKQSTLSVLATGKWRQYEIPYVVGGTNQGLIVESANSGDVNIDEPFVGLAPAGYIQDVGQAQFVGSLVYNSPNCQWATTSTTYASFPVDADCNASNITGNVESPDTKIPAIKILNARTDGHYRVEHHGLNYITNQTGACLFSLSSSSSFENKGITYTESSDRTGHQIIGDFRFETGGDKQVQVISYRLGGTGGECAVFGNDIVSSTFSVHFYPDASSTIVAQDTELTAATANEFSAYVQTGGLVSRENYNWISSCSKISEGDYNCNYENNVFTEIPNVSVNILSGSGSCRQHRIATSTLTGFRFQTLSTTGTLADCNVTVYASKQGADVNKSATIIGKFEQIEEVKADLTAATANELSASVTSAASITSQNYNYLSNCVNNFAGSYTCNFEAALFSESPSCVVTTESDGILAAISATSTSSLTVRTRRHDNSPLNAAFKLHCSKQGADVNKSFVGAVIKESSISQTKCQTKFLSLNRTSDVTNEPDLRFNNLTIGKKYELNLSFRSQRSSTGTDNIDLVINHNSSIVLVANHSHANAGGTSIYQTGASSKFTASTTEITTNLTSISTNSLVKGGDNRSSTWIELCQLPDTVIDTDEW